MHRLRLFHAPARGLATRSSVPATVRSAALYRPYATSGPKKAEEASAQSGGSRSMDAETKDTGGGLNDSLSDPEPVKGRTGGGEPLKASKNAPPQPKIHNASVPGNGEGLTEEQKKEVEKHNAEFDKKHDRAAPASEDKVDDKYWTGGRQPGKK